MLETGAKVEMTKGYKGVKGVILEKLGSDFQFYIVGLENGIKLVAGPSAFISIDG